MSVQLDRSNRGCLIDVSIEGLRPVDFLLHLYRLYLVQKLVEELGGQKRLPICLCPGSRESHLISKFKAQNSESPGALTEYTGLPY